MSALPKSSIAQQLTKIYANQTHSSEPLVSPRNVTLFAECFGIQLCDEKNTQSIVRLLKFWLKRLSLTATINPDEVDLLRAQIECTRTAGARIRPEHSFSPRLSPGDHLKQVLNESSICLNCENKKPFIFCRACRDLFCPNCFDKFHRKGNRSRHKQLSLLRCSYTDLCGNYAVVQCPLSGREFCPGCYVNTYLPGLPLADRKPPLRISYGSMWDSDTLTESFDLPQESGLTNDWHPFYDRDGIMFYFNFGTKESLRRSPVSCFDDEDPVADEKSDVSSRVSKLKPLYFSSPFSM